MRYSTSVRIPEACETLVRVEDGHCAYLSITETEVGCVWIDHDTFRPADAGCDFGAALQITTADQQRDVGMSSA